MKSKTNQAAFQPKKTKQPAPAAQASQSGYNWKKDAMKLSLKVVLGVVLVVWVLRGKMVDFKSLGAVILTPANLVLGLGFLLFSALVVTARWYILARAQGLS